MESDVFKLYSKYYNLFYADKQYAKEVEYVDRVIRGLLPGAKRILEYGSGTGGHGLLLKQKGYTILGIERSEEMAKVATAKGFDCRVGDITTYDVDGKFDVCIALFHVISYINDNESLIRLFQKTRNSLQKKGLFIFDVWFTPAVIGQKAEVRIKKAEDDEVSVTRIAEPSADHEKNTVQVRYHVFIKDKRHGNSAEFSEDHNMRHFGVPEIELLASQTGFKVLKAEEFVTGAKPSVNTWGVNFILEAS